MTLVRVVEIGLRDCADSVIHQVFSDNLGSISPDQCVVEESAQTMCVNPVPFPRSFFPNESSSYGCATDDPVEGSPL